MQHPAVVQLRSRLGGLLRPAAHGPAPLADELHASALRGLPPPMPTAMPTPAPVPAATAWGQSAAAERRRPEHDPWMPHVQAVAQQGRWAACPAAAARPYAGVCGPCPPSRAMSSFVAHPDTSHDWSLTGRQTCSTPQPPTAGAPATCHPCPCPAPHNPRRPRPRPHGTRSPRAPRLHPRPRHWLRLGAQPRGARPAALRAALCRTAARFPRARAPGLQWRCRLRWRRQQRPQQPRLRPGRLRPDARCAARVRAAAWQAAHALGVGGVPHMHLRCWADAAGAATSTCGLGGRRGLWRTCQRVPVERCMTWPLDACETNCWLFFGFFYLCFFLFSFFWAPSARASISSTSRPPPAR